MKKVLLAFALLLTSVTGVRAMENQDLSHNGEKQKGFQHIERIKQRISNERIKDNEVVTYNFSIDPRNEGISRGYLLKTFEGNIYVGFLKDTTSFIYFQDMNTDSFITPMSQLLSVEEKFTSFIEELGTLSTDYARNPDGPAYDIIQKRSRVANSILELRKKICGFLKESNENKAALNPDDVQTVLKIGGFRKQTSDFWGENKAVLNPDDVQTVLKMGGFRKQTSDFLEENKAVLNPDDVKLGKEEEKNQTALKDDTAEGFRKSIENDPYSVIIMLAISFSKNLSKEQKAELETYRKSLQKK